MTEALVHSGRHLARSRKGGSIFERPGDFQSPGLDFGAFCRRHQEGTSSAGKGGESHPNLEDVPMLEATTQAEEAGVAPVVGCLQALLAAHRPAFRQERPYRRCVALVLVSVFAFARHTLSQVLLTLGVTE